MNEAGKLKHRFHLLVFRYGDAPGQDILVEHRVVRRSQLQATLRRLCCRKYGPDHVGWIVEEAYWREFGMAGRNTK